MKSTLIDRLTVSLYEETLDDKILQEIMRRSFPFKFRGQKLKEIAMVYFRQNNPLLVKEIESELKGMVEPSKSTVNNGDVTTVEPPVKKRSAKFDTW